MLWYATCVRMVKTSPTTLQTTQLGVKAVAKDSDNRAKERVSRYWLTRTPKPIAERMMKPGADGSTHSSVRTSSDIGTEARQAAQLIGGTRLRRNVSQFSGLAAQCACAQQTILQSRFT
jgi:hypothetical protein